jgi:alkylhydroperoxidase/carboxymuconolactone decarboxylase family protein YurZ
MSRAGPTEALARWLDGQGVPEYFAADLRRLADACSAERNLPASVTNLALCFTYANRGLADEARYYGGKALEAGLTRPQAAEAVMAAILSRGFGMVESSLWLIEAAPDSDWPLTGGSPKMSVGQIRDYFEETFGSVPPGLDLLAQESPAAFSAYHGLRSNVLKDGALPRAHKELLLLIVNAVERYDLGMRVHMAGALENGASREDVLEAMRVAILGGGLVAWLEAANVFGEVGAE